MCPRFAHEAGERCLRDAGPPDQRGSRLGLIARRSPPAAPTALSRTRRQGALDRRAARRARRPRGRLLNVAEFAIAIGLLFGIATQLAALGALALIGPIWLMLLDEGPYLWSYPVELVPLLILAIVPAGRVLGVDRRLAVRFGGRWPF
ncbi:hypothetical protein [Pseudonocardia kunmingensis]|uniref:DoxX-like protein n=1 Tax=Pseudonocardia kunmingensis TaxID=630975 RepID=A0A543DKN1_9PSEU|nr:hypothetical protein [Pseudonocardia kunmingensis]TQM09894.1 hypothetical protein FB558_5670 [Pseudonocardia kunmingensis]